MNKYYFITIAFTIIFHSFQFAQEFDELSKAVSEKDIDRITELLDEGINVDVQPEDTPVTVLIIACSYPGYEDMVSLLISKEADVNFRGKGGKTPLMWAAGNSYKSTKLLLENSADVKAKADDGMTAFIQATLGVQSKRISTDVMDLLLDNGADVNATITGKDVSGWTALLFATVNGDEELVEYLLRQGAFVNHTSDEGQSALALARQEKYESLIQLLKKHGALD
jgi:serine/threonine-protein phosphatase 6 regulatory ankyrin repeat subunit B